MSLLLFGALTYAAESGCPPLYEVEMRELVDAQYQVLLADELPDVAEHDRLSRALEARLPCAGFPVEADLWSRYLVSIAIREYFRGGDWRKPLTTALRIAPDVEIPVREGHPLRSFRPGAAPAPTGPVPDEVRLRKDGVEITEIVPLDATHLLQRPEGDGFLTAVVVGPAEIPREFLSKPSLPEAERDARRRRLVRTWGTVGAGALLAGGAASLAVGYDAHNRFVDPETPEEELPGLIARGRPAYRVGGVLVGVGATGAAVVWAVPW